MCAPLTYCGYGSRARHSGLFAADWMMIAASSGNRKPSCSRLRAAIRIWFTYSLRVL